MDQNNDDRGIDLSHALDDSSSRIKFEGEEFQRSRQSFQTPTPKIVELVVKYSGGAVKDEKAGKLCFDWVCRSGDCCRDYFSV